MKSRIFPQLSESSSSFQDLILNFLLFSYLQLDAKKSPLALLAQTCSQIGADSSSVKPLLSLDKNKKPSETAKSPPATVSKTPKSNTTPEIKPLAFKPYETNVLTKTDDRPSSKSSSANGSVLCYDKKSKNCASRSPSRNSTDSPEISVVNRDTRSESLMDKASPDGGAAERKSVSPSGSSQRGASPIIRSGLEVLQGSQKDISMGTYKPGAFGMGSLAALCCPPGMEQHTNPAFRPPFSGAFSHHHAAMLAAAAAGYQSSTAAANAAGGPYVSYARVKTPSGGEAIVPVCKDPFCTGCQYSAHNQQMMMGAPCPSGCTQCEHQKYGLAMAMSSLPASHPYSQLGRPFICNWISGESYCGKRFGTSDELLQHLRTHTSSLADPAAAAAALAAQSQQAMMHPLGSLFGASALHRAYPTPPLSPMSMARYHPYSKPGSIPTTLAQSPYAAYNPALNPYYSPYAMYGQRIGTTAVHP